MKKKNRGWVCWLQLEHEGYSRCKTSEATEKVSGRGDLWSMHILQKVKNAHVLEVRKFSIWVLLEGPDKKQIKQANNPHGMSVKDFKNWY